MTGNHVADVPDVAPAAVPAPPEPVGHRPARLPVLVGVGAGLAVVLVLLGRQPWQLPVRDGDGLADVPQSLLTFLLLGAAVCVWTAGRLVRPASTLPSRGAAHLWWGLLASAAAVSLAADLSLASFAGAGIGQPPGDLVVRGLVPVVPAVLAGLLAADAGRTARIRAALGTGVITVPLTALGWALASSAPWSAAGPGDVLAMAGLAGGAPLALAVAFVAADRRGQVA